MAQSTQTSTPSEPAFADDDQPSHLRGRQHRFALCVDSATETVAQSTRTRERRGLCRLSDLNRWVNRQCAAVAEEAALSAVTDLEDIRQGAATGSGFGDLGDLAILR